MRAAPRFVTDRRLYLASALFNAVSAFVNASLGHVVPTVVFCCFVWAFVGLALTERGAE